MDDAFATMEQNELVQQLPQLRDIDRDPPRIILAEQLCRRLLKLRAIDSRFLM